MNEIKRCPKCRGRVYPIVVIYRCSHCKKKWPSSTNFIVDKPIPENILEPILAPKRTDYTAQVLARLETVKIIHRRNVDGVIKLLDRCAYPDGKAEYINPVCYTCKARQECIAMYDIACGGGAC